MRIILFVLTLLISSNAFAYESVFRYFDKVTDRYEHIPIVHTYLKQYRDRYRDLWLNNEYEGAANSLWITDEVRDAWADGYTGNDINIAVVDNFRLDNYGISSHGDRVSSIIDGDTIYGETVAGIAPDSNVTDIQLRDFGGYVLDQNYDIVNLSIGSSIGNHRIRPNEIRFENGMQEYTFGNYTFTARKLDKFKGLIVTSAGNSAYNCNTNQSCDPFNVSLVLGNDDNTLVVGTINEDNEILSNSNKAGILKDNYVVDTGIFQAGNSWRYEATSYSAPTVTGKAAIIKSKFPELNGSELANVIKLTADDLGAPGVDDVYGHGKVNLARALSPIGSLH